MNFNLNAADFDAPGTEIVLHNNNNEGLDDVNELPFSNDFDDEAPIHRGTSFFGRNRNKLISVGMTAAVVLFVSGTSIAVSHNNRIASNFNTLPKACKVSKSKAPKLSKAPKQSKAPTPQGTPSRSPIAITPQPDTQGTPSPIAKTFKPTTPAPTQTSRRLMTTFPTRQKVSPTSSPTANTPAPTQKGTPSPIAKTSKAPKESKAPKTKAPTIICTKSPTSIAPKSSKVPKIPLRV
mmetsp:Transcript_13168/g.21637  ORF Transcript_13168/g.21637 Transcript_13168/m.21637 type:complete len:236 (-) Transcript_13168:285-992(-)